MKEHYTYEPGPEQWQRYLDGTMSPGEKQLFDQYLQNDEFAQEALEGFKNDPGALQYFTQQQTSLTQLPTPAANKLFLKFIIAGAMVTTAAVSGYFMLRKGESRTSNREYQISDEPPQLLSEETYAVLDSEFRAIESLHPIATTKQLVVGTKKENKVTFTEITLTNQTNELQPVDVTNIPEEIIPDPKEIEIAPADNHINRIVKKMPLLSFHNFKVVDYSGEYTAPIETKKIILSGTPANQEGPDQPAPEMNDERIEHIPYNDYLRETMQYVAAKQYRTALKRFRNIYASYPNDVNMFFYSGLCYYNLGREGQALAAFEKCILHEIDEFKPEAEWCKTLVLLESGRKKEAIRMLKKIENEKGFYSQQAREKLQTLK